MKKRILSIALTLCMVLMLVPTTAFAETSGNYTYTVSNDEATITKFNDNTATEVTIPSTIDDYPVTAIGAYAFNGCTSLKSVEIPDSVNSIGNSAFYGCISLESVEIPSSVETIGAYTFDGCTSLESVKIPNSVTSIGNYAFRNCTGLKSITIPRYVETIGIGAFRNCTGLESVEIPDSVTSIGYEAFNGCISLASVEIPNRVNSIGKAAFYGCISLASVIIGSGVQTIGDYAFKGCASLEKFVVAENNAYYSSLDGVLFKQDKTQLIAYPCGKTDTSYTIPNSVNSIGNSAFYGCENLESVTIPSGVQTINSWTFAECTSLESVIIGRGVKTIEGRAFDGCTSLASVEIPDNVTSIVNNAFDGCTSLASVIIGSGVQTIGNYAFKGCASLEKFVVAENNACYSSSVDDVLFDKNKTKLITYPCGKTGSSYTIPDSVTSIGNSAFDGCTSLASVEIPDSVTNIGNDAFYGCISLESVTIPSSVKTIGDYAFKGCASLEKFVVAENNACYSSSDGVLFNQNKTQLIAYPCGNTDTSYTIPNSVTYIKDDAFYGCENLESVTIPNGVKTINRWTFAYCTSLESVEIPDSITSIGDGAFAGCESLASVTIPNGVKTIGMSAFYGCTSLASVIIGSGVHNIGEGAFKGCTSLESIFLPNWLTVGSAIIPNTATQVGYILDADKVIITKVNLGDGRTTVEIPSSICGYPVTSIGNSAFDGCTSLASIFLPNWLTFGSAEIPNTASQVRYSLDTDKVTITKVNLGDGRTTFNIPSSICGYPVTSIGDCAFADCTSLERIVVDENNAYYSSSVDGVLFDKNKTQLITYPCGKTATSYTIPDGVTSIGNSAFDGCTSLASIFLPNGLTVGSAGIPNTASQVRYSLDADKVTITEIILGTDKEKVDIPDTISGCSVVAVAEAYHPYVGNHTHKYSDRTCALCGYIKPSSNSGSSTYTITVEPANNGDVTSSHKTASKGTTVTLTVVPDKGCTLETLTVTDGSGNEIELTDKGDGKYTFTMPASKVTVTATYMEDNSMLNFFVDVFPGDYYYDAVLWAAENGITGGVDDTHFAPNAPCTRAQSVTFLWRAAGCPTPQSREMPFTDVAEGSYYYDAVLWAVENGITKGTSDTTFDPDATCNRGQIVTFLWRSQNSPAAGSGNPFDDVKADDYYADAVLWAVKENVTNGTSDTTFSPGDDCTRAQIVTFLFRCLGGE